VEASGSHPVMGVVWVFHGREVVSHGRRAVADCQQAAFLSWQAVLVVRWFDVGWHHYCHPCKGTN